MMVMRGRQWERPMTNVRFKRLPVEQVQVPLYPYENLQGAEDRSKTKEMR